MRITIMRQDFYLGGLSIFIMAGMGFLVLSGFLSPAMAYAPEDELLKIKGYSPEVIEVANRQRSRQEWKQPSIPANTPGKKLIHNLFYGNWLDGVDDFGSQQLRTH